MRILMPSLLAVCVLAAPFSANAQEKPPETPPSETTPAVVMSVSPSAAGKAIDEAELAELSGRQGSGDVGVLSDQDLVAVNNGNTIVAGRVNSGQIDIARGAFDGFAGVGNFVINSGHNNNLQGAITINIVQP